MDEKVMLWRLGILVLSTILVAATLILYLGQGIQSTYRLNVYADKAPGVTPETPIHRNGVLIGRVDSVETLDEGGVKMVLRINDNVRLFDDEIAQIGLTSLLGDSIIEFVPGKDGIRGDLLTDGNTILNDQVNVMQNPLEGLKDMEAKFKETSDSITATSNKIGGLADELRIALGEDPDKSLKKFFEQIQALTTQASSTMKRFDDIGKNLNDVFGDEKTKATLKDLITIKLPTAFERMEKLGMKIDASFAEDGILNKIEGVVNKANDRLEEIGKFTNPESEFGKKLVKTLDGIEEFFEGVNNSEGTVGLLLNDPSLYHRMNNSLRRIDSITYKLEPILKDVRVFSSKIATDPRQLGVKGALDRRPSGSGIKGNFLVPPSNENERFSPRNFFRE